MNSNYIQALETKGQWARWLAENADDPDHFPRNASDVVEAYMQVLATPDTHFMNSKFCELVDRARRSVPDDLKFDLSWTHSKTGWLWMETPFGCPHFNLNEELLELASKCPNAQKHIDVQIHAIGWMPIAEIEERESGARHARWAPDGGSSAGTAFLLFHSLGRGFGMWSYFTLKDGDKVIDRIRVFEGAAKKEGGNYALCRETDMLHEIRWVYTAFHLMAQRLAVEVPSKVDRGTKRRALRTNSHCPDEIKVVSLRKLEADRERAKHEPHSIDWECQWTVDGHWRNQWYAAAGEHRSIFIEAYLKGPDDKPFKAPSHKLFAAVR